MGILSAHDLELSGPMDVVLLVTYVVKLINSFLTLSRPTSLIGCLNRNSVSPLRSIVKTSAAYSGQQDTRKSDCCTLLTGQDSLSKFPASGNGLTQILGPQPKVGAPTLQRNIG